MTIYTPTTITIDEVTEPVRYTIRRNGNVLIHLTRIDCDYEVTPTEEGYSEALEAANTRKSDDLAESIKKLNAAKADGTKWWIGQTIKGRGWIIDADASYDRIRVIFRRPPTEEQKQAVKDHKFCWSPTLKSWNRGLKCKAWRDAEHLALVLKDMDDPSHRWSKSQERKAI